MRKLHVIYIPGLGDTHVIAQRLAVRAWRIWGVEAEVCQMKWGDGEPWEGKLQRLRTKIDKLIAEGNEVALAGASAGAAAVVNAYALYASQVVGCVLIAGKVNRPESLSESHLRHEPAFVQSAWACEKSLQGLGTPERERILSRYALADGIVPRPDSYIAGARNQTVPTFGHAFTIGVQLVFGAPGFLRFLKGCQKKLRRP